MTMLLLLNGAPGVGKSTLAQRFLSDHPLALLVEVDALRISLGRWSELEDSKLAARTLALALVDAHLREGHDVIVPQYLGRTEFIEALAGVAGRQRARFIEIILSVDKSEILHRFRARRDHLAGSAEMHPADDVPIEDIEAVADDWLARLAAIRDVRPYTQLIAARETVDETYATVLAFLSEENLTERPIPHPTLRWNAVCVDCRDVDELAEFYGRLLGWEIVARDSGWIRMSDPRGGVSLNFQSESWYTPPVWPEQSGEQSKMLHLEVHVDDLESAVLQSVRLGAREALHQPPDREPANLRVMLDPAGHPFCLWSSGP